MTTHLDPHHIQSLLDRMAADLTALFQEQDIRQFVIVGIRTGGAWVAEALAKRLPPAPLGTLDISFYRDDFSRRGLSPTVQPSHLPMDLEDAHVLLVDDVLMTGRTLRAALNALFDYGRPASVRLAVLFDVGRRELPFAADVTGEWLPLDPHQRVELRGPAPLCADILSLKA